MGVGLKMAMNAYVRNGKGFIRKWQVFPARLRSITSPRVDLLLRAERLNINPNLRAKSWRQKNY
jgi:hypothetical protein